MSTILAMEERRQRALFELHGLIALQMERELLPYEARMMRKWASLVEEMDDHLRDAYGQSPSSVHSGADAPVLIGPSGPSLP